MEKKKTTNMMRPVTVRVKQLKSDIQKAVVECELPPFMIEMILGESLAGISLLAQKEYMQDQIKWEEKIKKDMDAKGGEKNV